MKTKLALIAAAASLMFIATPVSAHHSFAGTYLEDATPVTIEITIVLEFTTVCADGSSRLNASSTNRSP